MMRAISSPSRSREEKEREAAFGPAPGTVVDVVATLGDQTYWTLLMAFSSLSTTDFGNLA